MQEGKVNITAESCEVFAMGVNGRIKCVGTWWTPLGSVTAKGNVAYIHISRWPREVLL